MSDSSHSQPGSHRPARRLVPDADGSRKTHTSSSLAQHRTRAGACRVIGPYAEGDKFRLVVFAPVRKSVWCQTLQEAETLKLQIDRAMRDRGNRTVGEALDEYLLHQREAGLKASTLSALSDKLTRFLPCSLALDSLTPALAAKLYRDETTRIGRFGPISACTHQMVLRSTKAFFRFLVEDRHYLPSNPWDKVKPIGRANVGKLQLTIDEGRRLSAWLFERAASGDEGATALLMQLVLGLRSSEVLQRRVRDLDDRGQVLSVPAGKTRSARRFLKIGCEPLRALLQRQVQGKSAQDFLFGRGQPLHTDYLWNRLQRYCGLAGVPKVCPHSLRGLHSTIATERGATSSVVAAALGHTSFAITARHYVDTDVLANAKNSKVTEILMSPTPPSPDADPS